MYQSRNKGDDVGDDVGDVDTMWVMQVVSFVDADHDDDHNLDS